MKPLYEINRELELALFWQSEDANETDDETWCELINEVAIERSEKIDGVCSYIKTLRAEAEAIKAEQERLADRRKRAEKRAEWLEGYLRSNLQECEQFKTARNEIKWRKSESVQITDESRIPLDYMRVVPETKAPDKMAIKKAIKDGGDVSGAELIVKQNMSIN